MKTSQRWAKALNQAVEFVDQFGNNFGDTKLTDVVKVTTEGNKIVVTNHFGTTKNFVFGNAHTRQIFDEIASCFESFKTNYKGYVLAHQGSHSGKIITTLSSKILLNETLSSRERVAVVILKDKEVTVRYEVTETFTEFH